MREKLSLAEEAGENLDFLLESLRHGLEVMKAVEDSLTYSLESIKHSQEITKGTVKECLPN